MLSTIITYEYGDPYRARTRIYRTGYINRELASSVEKVWDRAGNRRIATAFTVDKD